jgi:hypothetical protein
MRTSLAILRVDVVSMSLQYELQRASYLLASGRAVYGTDKGRGGYRGKPVAK